MNIWHVVEHTVLLPLKPHFQLLNMATRLKCIGFWLFFSQGNSGKTGAKTSAAATTAKTTLVSTEIRHETKFVIVLSSLLWCIYK